MTLTLCGSFSCSSCQGDDTFVYLRWGEKMDGHYNQHRIQNDGYIDLYLTSKWKIPLDLTLIPTRTSRSLIILTKDTPLSEYWYSVSWKTITPPRQLLIRSSALMRICRNCLRFSSVFSTPTWARRFPMLPVVSTWSGSLASSRGWLGMDAGVLQTNRLVCSQDALPWRNYTESRLLELPLLRLGERRDLVCHADGPTAFGWTVDDLFTLRNRLFFWVS